MWISIRGFDSARTARLILLLAPLLLRPEIPCAQNSHPLAVGYYPNWFRDWYPSGAVLYKDLTHIVHAFLIPDSTGSFSNMGDLPYPSLVQSAHQYGLKVIVSLGGWGQSNGFSPSTADTTLRRRFVNNLVAFCATNGYDGVDIDWEFPATKPDSANLKLFVHELRLAFNGITPHHSISLAVPGGDWWGRWYDFAGLANDVDWFGVMTYDYYGDWMTVSGPNSPLYGSSSTNTQGWIDDSYTYFKVTRSVPVSKILIGIPLYGWVFNASTMYGPSTGAYQEPYQTIAPRLDQGWTRHWDSQGQVPYIIDSGATHVISYDDTVSIGAKCAYVLQKGIPGAIIWALGQDLLNGQQPLLSAIGKGLGLVTGVEPSREVGKPATFALLQNFPNPFNPSTTIRFELPRAAVVKLTVIDVLGQSVATLVDERRPAGVQTIRFDGSSLASGTYFYRLETETVVATKRMMLLK